MANANAVMQTVKTRADPQAITQPTKAAPEVGMLEIFTQLADGNQGHKLTGANAIDASRALTYAHGARYGSHTHPAGP